MGKEVIILEIRKARGGKTHKSIVKYLLQHFHIEFILQISKIFSKFLFTNAWFCQQKLCYHLRVIFQYLMGNKVVDTFLWLPVRVAQTTQKYYDQMHLQGSKLWPTRSPMRLTITFSPCRNIFKQSHLMDRTPLWAASFTLYKLMTNVCIWQLHLSSWSPKGNLGIF